MLKCEVHGEKVERRPMRGNRESLGLELLFSQHHCLALKFCDALRGGDIKILLRGNWSTLQVR